MELKYCIPIIPSTDLEKSLRFWIEGLHLTMDSPMYRDGKLIGCMVHNDKLYFWLNQRADEPVPEIYAGISLYWTPVDIHQTRTQLQQLGFHCSDIEIRHYGQTEFVVTDLDGYTHCFGITTTTNQPD